MVMFPLGSTLFFFFFFFLVFVAVGVVVSR